MQNPADSLASDDRNSQKKTQASYLRHYHAGVEFFVAVGLLTWGGWWLDKRWGTLPVFTLVGLALGFGGGFRALYREVYGDSTRSDASEATSSSEAVSGSNAAGKEDAGKEDADADAAAGKEDADADGSGCAR